MIEHRIMYVCTECADAMPECCGHYDRADLAVMPDGRWLRESCFENEMWDLCDPPLFRDMPRPSEYRPTEARDE